MSIFCPNCMKEIEEGQTKCPLCGGNVAISNRPHQLQPMSILNGRYLIGRVLGEGGFGITYIGLDLRLNVTVAIKEYYPAGMVNRYSNESTELTPTTEENRKALEEGKKQFFNEAVIVGKFKEDAHIINVIDFFYENGTAYIVMEYIDGDSLQTYLDKNGPVSDFNTLYSLMKPVLMSLEKIHNAGLIHRDISPSNIMIKKDGTIKILDFGTAKDINSNNENSMSVVLKHGYAPPEQYAKHGKQGTWTDVYAICATMYKMLTGKTLETSPDRLNSGETLRNLQKSGIKIYKSQQKVLEKGLAVKSEDRIQTMSELIDGLDKASQKPDSKASALKIAVPALIAVIVACVAVFSSGNLKVENSAETESATPSPEIILEEVIPNRAESPFKGVRGTRNTLIASGYEILGIRKDGVIVCNYDTSDFTFIPDVSDWKDIIEVISGNDYVAGLKKDGTVLINSYYEEFDSVDSWSDIVKIIPAIYDNYIVGLKKDGTVVYAGNGSDEFYGISECKKWTDVTDITSGANLIGLKKDGAVVNTGSMYSVMDTSKMSNIVKIACNGSSDFIIGITDEGKVETASGPNANYYKLDKLSSLTDIADATIGTGYIVFTKNDGSICVLDYYKDEMIYPKWTDVKETFAGSNLYGAVFNDGRIAVVDNSNVYGIDETEEINNVETVIVSDAIFLVMKDGTVKTYGEDINGKTNVSDWSNIAKLSCSGSYTIGLKKDATAVVTEPYTETEFGPPDEWTDVEAIASSGNYLAAIKSDGTVLMSGNDDYGICEVKDWTDIADIELCWNFCMGLKKDGSLVCSGNSYLIDGLTDLKNVKDITSGSICAAVLMENGRVVVSENNYIVVDGNDYRDEILRANQWTKIEKITMSLCGNLIAGLCEDGTVRCAGAHEYGSNWQGIVDLCCGGYYGEQTQEDGTTKDVDTIVLVGIKSDGTVIAEGNNDFGQIDTVKQWTNIAEVAVGNNIIVGLNNDGNILIAGDVDSVKNTECLRQIRLPNE